MFHFVPKLSAFSCIERFLGKTFIPFFTSKKGGSRIGLALSMRSYYAKGQLLCSSEEGKGADFTIYLRIKINDGKKLKSVISTERRNLSKFYNALDFSHSFEMTI